MQIIFTDDYQVDDCEATTFHLGQVLTCSHSTAEHFKRKGVAEEYHKGRQMSLEASAGTAEAGAKQSRDMGEKKSSQSGRTKTRSQGPK